MQEFTDVQPKKKSSSGCWSFFFLFTLLALLVGGAFVWWKYFYNFSEGYRTGLLQKLSHKGNVFKTYEGELILSSVISSGNVTMASEKFFFSVVNDSVARAMMNAQGQRMKLHYVEKKGALPWRGETTYIVDSFVVEPEYYQAPFGGYPAPAQNPQQQVVPQNNNYQTPPPNTNYPQQGQPVDQNGYPVQPQQQQQTAPQNYPQQQAPQQQPQYQQQPQTQQPQPQQSYPPSGNTVPNNPNAPH